MGRVCAARSTPVTALAPIMALDLDSTGDLSEEPSAVSSGGEGTAFSHPHIHTHPHILTVCLSLCLSSSRFVPTASFVGGQSSRVEPFPFDSRCQEEPTGVPARLFLHGVPFIGTALPSQRRCVPHRSLSFPCLPCYVLSGGTATPFLLGQICDRTREGGPQLEHIIICLSHPTSNSPSGPA